jgi:hypothetical protein
MTQSIKSSKYESQIEPVIDTVEKITLSSRQMLKSAPSLRPGLAMMEAAAEGNLQACAVRDAWQFKEPIRKVSREQFEAMVTRNPVVFHG